MRHPTAGSVLLSLTFLWSLLAPALAAETPEEPSASVAGTVRDPGGEPVAGVEVSAFPEDSSGPIGAPKLPSARATTAADGGFRLTGLDPTTNHEVVAWTEGRAPAVTRVPPGSAGADGRPRPVEGVDLVLHPPFRVTGRAVDEEGRPLAGARATLIRRDELFGHDLWLEIEEHTRTAGADGRFAFDTPFPAPSLLVVRADGLAPHLRTGIEIDPAAGDLDLGDAVLYPQGVLRGRVVDRAGDPVAGAEIHEEIVSTMGMVRDLFDGVGLRQVLAVTDAHGAFSAGGFLPAEPLMVRAELDGAASEERWILAAPEPLPLELVLAPPARIAGTVVDADGRPVAGASVSPGPLSSPETSHFAWTRTDAEGRFQVTVGEPGRAILVADARGHARSEPLEVEVTGGTRIDDLEIELRRGFVLEGRVVDPAGRPIEGVELSAASGSRVVWTDGEGRFALEDRPAGTVVLDLRRQGYLSQEVPVDHAPDGEPVEVVYPTAEIAGTLQAADGTPAGGYKVQLTDRDSEWLVSEARQVTTAADGSFRFRGVADGTYLLRVFGPEGRPYGWDRPEPVVVEDGGSVTGVEVTLPRPESSAIPSSAPRT